jgi:hypothetical protein
MSRRTVALLVAAPPVSFGVGIGLGAVICFVHAFRSERWLERNGL